jgi:SAM-dependent methyltransferase
MPPSASLDEVAAYYSAKVREHGATPRGVDWNSAESQRTRFDQLLNVVGEAGTVADYGCGYAALLDHMRAAGFAHEYVGYDIAPAMLDEARRRHPGVRFTDTESDLAGADFVLASGVFNVRLTTPLADWRAYVLATIGRLAGLSARGFAFNCLTSYSDTDRMRDNLYYADPCELFDHCKRRYSRNVALLHDYNLYEFTILVRLP